MESTPKKRQRTCVACGQQDTKMQLHRFVRTADGTVVYDAGGRMPGRGAYVCSPECLAAAAKGHRLDRTLKTKLTNDDYQRLADEFQLALGESAR